MHDLVAEQADDRGRARGMLLAPVALLLGLIALYLWAIRTGTGQDVDVRLFAWAQSANDELSGPAGTLRKLLPVGLGAVAAVLGLMSLRRRDWRPIGTAVVIVVVSAVAARVLRDAVFDRPYLGDFGYRYNTFPSGHVALTASLASAVVVLWAGRLRGAVIAIGILITALSCVASVIGFAHRPSDALAGVLLVLLVASLTTWLPGHPRKVEPPHGPVDSTVR